MSAVTVPLGDLADVVSGGTPKRSEPSFFGGEIQWVKISDMLQGTIMETDETISQAGLDASSAKLLPAGTLLLSIFATIGRTAVLSREAATNQAIAGLKIKDESKTDRGYLRRYLESTSDDLAGQGRGVAQANINLSILRSHPIPLPPIEEQRRIAAVLDAADALQTKRRQALAKLDTLTQAIFIDMFGDLTQSAIVPAPFESLLLRPLRNGISPSKSGMIAAQVLTLSAITGRSFDSRAVKESTFTKQHDEEKTVAAEDFLICRGNGNLSLVGRGKHPEATMSDCAFPDTMIAARCDPKLVSRPFLAHVWDQPLIREQVERLARTTNGTHKINQTMIESIELPLPPIKAQQKFDLAQRSITGQRNRLDTEAALLDSLFSSLQQRAFRGELDDSASHKAEENERVPR